MSAKHPVIAVTGSPGSGASTVRRAFADIFRRQGIHAQFVQGAGFHRYTAAEVRRVIDEAAREGRTISRFGPECNLFTELEDLFAGYGRTGAGKLRFYVPDEAAAARHGGEPGHFTPWRAVDAGTHVLFYEGMHGGVAARTWGRRRATTAAWPAERERRIGARGVDVAQHVDLLIGVAPSINLEWIQKIHADCDRATCTTEQTVETILRRLPDYIQYIAPQFALTDINIQRIPTVDTSNPFIARDVPSPAESVLVIHFRDPEKFDFPDLVRRIPGSYMTRPNTMLAPGGELSLALETICGPLVAGMIEDSSAQTA
jgi:phosphoribulokinase